MRPDVQEAEKILSKSSVKKACTADQVLERHKV
jgi:ribosomal protein L36